MNIHQYVKGKSKSSQMKITSSLVKEYKQIIDDDTYIEYVPHSLLSIYKPWNETLGVFPKGTIHLKNNMKNIKSIQVNDKVDVCVQVNNEYQKNGKNYFEFETVYSVEDDIVAIQNTTYLSGFANQESKQKRKNNTKKDVKSDEEIINSNYNFKKNYQVNQEKINQYAFFSGGTADIHTNPDYAKSTPFGRTLVHGLLLKALIQKELSRIYEDWDTKGYLEIVFRKPVKVDDLFTICIKSNDNSAEVIIVNNDKIATMGKAFLRDK